MNLVKKNNDKSKFIYLFLIFGRHDVVFIHNKQTTFFSSLIFFKFFYFIETLVFQIHKMHVENSKGCPCLFHRSEIPALFEVVVLSLYHLFYNYFLIGSIIIMVHAMLCQVKSGPYFISH